MSSIILADAPAPHRRNVQLGEREQTCVYTSTTTNRILGFGHASMAPMFTEGWKREILYHAKDIELWMDRYRKQEQEDQESDDYRKTMREAPARAAIRAALVARRNHVGPRDRAYIDASIAVMDQRAARAQRRQLARSVLLAEKYTSDTSGADIALDSPIFKAKES